MKNHQVLDVDLHLYKVTPDGVARPHTADFYSDTVAAQGWHPLGAGELEPEWTVRGCESRAKLFERENPPADKKPVIKAAKKKGSAK